MKRNVAIKNTYHRNRSQTPAGIGNLGQKFILLNLIKQYIQYIQQWILYTLLYLFYLKFLACYNNFSIIYYRGTYYSRLQNLVTGSTVDVCQPVADPVVSKRIAFYQPVTKRVSTFLLMLFISLLKRDSTSCWLSACYETSERLLLTTCSFDLFIGMTLTCP